MRRDLRAGAKVTVLVQPLGGGRPVPRYGTVAEFVLRFGPPGSVPESFTCYEGSAPGIPLKDGGVYALRNEGITWIRGHQELSACQVLLVAFALSVS